MPSTERPVDAAKVFMSDRPFNALFLCTGNSARSIMAEALMNHWGKGRFKGYSAGSNRTGWVHPFALKLLKQAKLPTEELRSKNWDEFAAPGAPQMDFVFTVCDKAAGESCPIFGGQPMTAHWGVEDPVWATGSERIRLTAFREAYRVLENRIKIFVSLPIAALDRMKLQSRLDDIGHTLPTANLAAQKR